MDTGRLLANLQRPEQLPETASGQVSIATTHLAKGLAFRAVVVIACDDEVVPLQDRIDNVG
jgi:superfamily I DNA/RNA helicase